MPINVYTGLMRSGKSYEVVSSVILDAIAQGRRVVTNVDGINNERIRAYLADKRKLKPEQLGEVCHVTNEDVFRTDFFPYYDDAKSAHTDTVVQPGDLVCVDEAWRFWGTDCKLLKEHKSFFLEHGHFTHPETGVACDLVLMIQDMGTLHRFVKNVVAFSFRTHKKVSLGLGQVYSINMYEGWKQNGKTSTGTWVKKYKPEIFPLYQSFKDGAQGKTVNADARQNILASKKLWALVGGMVLTAGMSARYTWLFFHPKPKEGVQAAAPEPGKPSVPGAATPAPATPGVPASPGYSDAWRVVGRYESNGTAWVVVANAAGHLRVESPSVFNNDGMAMIGMIDGQRVTRWTGGASSSLVGESKK